MLNSKIRNSLSEKLKYLANSTTPHVSPYIDRYFLFSVLFFSLFFLSALTQQKMTHKGKSSRSWKKKSERFWSDSKNESISTFYDYWEIMAEISDNENYRCCLWTSARKVAICSIFVHLHQLFFSTIFLFFCVVSFVKIRREARFSRLSKAAVAKKADSAKGRGFVTVFLQL